MICICTINHGGLGMKANLVLTGFMGTGKTTIGQLIAAQMELPFIDTDDVIVAAAGRSIPEVFTTQGEAAFRQIEADLCVWLAKGRGQVIATGGGAMLNPDIRAAFESSSLIVCLRCNLDEIARRVHADLTERPLFQNMQQVQQLLEKRQLVYDSFPIQLDTTHRSAAQIAEEIIELWQKP